MGAAPGHGEERDEPRGLCVGGYPTQAQGRFAGSPESFDTATSTWAPVDLIEDGVCPRTCCAAPGPGSSERMYMLSRDGHLVARAGAAAASAWRPVAQVPEDARTVATVPAIPDGRVVVIREGGVESMTRGLHMSL